MTLKWERFGFSESGDAVTLSKNASRLNCDLSCRWEPSIAIATISSDAGLQLTIKPTENRIPLVVHGHPLAS